MHTRENNHRRRECITAALVVVVLLLLALTFSYARAKNTTNPTATTAVSSSSSSSSAITSTTLVAVAPKTVTAMTTFRPTWIGGSSSSHAAASAAPSVADNVALLKSATADRAAARRAVSVQTYVASAGTPTEGQVLTFKSGRISWEYPTFLHDAAGAGSDGTVGISGYGRKPGVIDANGNRHYAGGGGGGAGNSVSSGGGSGFSQSDADPFYVNVAGDTMVGGLVIAVNGLGLTVAGTMSGNIIHAENTLSTSGSLVWEGAASGSTLYVATSFDGAGLVDCSNNAAHKLLWDAATKRFSCGSDQGGIGGSSPEVGTASFSGATIRIADARYVRTSGGTMTGSLTVQATISGRVLNISRNASVSGTLMVLNGITSRGTLSGNILHAEKSLTTSGSLVFEGAASGSSLYVATSFNGAGLADCDISGSSKLLWDATTGRFSCGTDNTGGSAGTAAFSGAVLRLGDERYVRTSGDTMTGALIVQATISGRTLIVSNNASVSGSLVVLNSITARGTLSGASLFVARNASVSGSVLVENLLSGATIGGFGLTSCSTATTNKLLFNSTTGTFVCGTDQGGSFGSGNVLTLADARYVRTSGGTMTGALTVRATISGSRLVVTGNANITGALLVVGGITSRGTISGSILHASTQLRSSGTLVVNGATRLKSTLTILGTASGNILHAEKSLTTSGSLVFEGTASGSNLYVATSINGAGLADCDTSGTSKLLWDATTGRFSCGTDQNTGGFGSGNVLTLGDARYVRTSGGTMTGALTVRGTISGSRLIISNNATVSGSLVVLNGIVTRGTLSGAALFVARNASVSGSLLVENLMSGATIGGFGLVDCSNSTSSKLLYNATTGKFVCSTDQTGGAGAPEIGTQSFSGATLRLADARYVRTSGGTMTGALAVQATISGTRLVISGNANITGSLLVKNNITARGTISGALITQNGGGNNYFLGNVGIGTMSPSQALDVVGTVNTSTSYRLNTNTILNFSGTVPRLGDSGGWTGVAIYGGSSEVVRITDGGNVGIGTTSPETTLEIIGTASGRVLHAQNTLSTSGSLVFEGAASGSSLYVATSINGAGLADCDTAGVSKLLWDATTGRFSCGTDQTAGSGLGINDADLRYVNVAGDTMTGVLVLQNGTVHSATNTPLLNVRGTMSGRSLYISGTGASPLLMTDITKGYVGIGSTAPKAKLDVLGTISGSLITQNGSGANYFLGKLGVGIAPQQKFEVYDTQTNFGTKFLQRNRLITHVTTTGTNYGLGLDASVIDMRINQGVTDNGYRLGVRGEAYAGTLAFSGTLAGQYGVQGRAGINIASTGAVVTNAYAGYFQILNDVPNTTISNAYGVYIDNDDTVGTITNRYGIYQLGNTAFNYFAGNVGIGTTAPKAKLDVVGAISGSRLIISNNASVSGSLVVLNGITARGTLSGASLYVARNASVSGSVLVENLMSGATIGGFGLVDCSNSTTSKLLYNATTGKFVCSTDQTGGAGAPEIGTNSFSGATLRLADARYVRTSGGTMTGALVINITGGNNNTIGLNVLNALSGAVLHAEKTLTSSGSFALEGASHTYVVIQSRGDNTLDRGIKFLSQSGSAAGFITLIPNTVGTNAKMFFYVGGPTASDVKMTIDDDGLVAINKAAGTAKATLDVLGTISGSLVTQNGAGNNYFLGNVAIGTGATASRALYVASSTTPVTFEYSGTAAHGIQTLYSPNITAAANANANLNWQSINSAGTVMTFGTIGLNYADKTSGSEDSNILFSTRDAGSLAEKVRIQSDGFVGIGKTAPSTKLDVVGTISGSLITQNGAGTNYFRGILGIGTTSPTQNLEVSGTGTVVSRVTSTQATYGRAVQGFYVGTKLWDLGNNIDLTNVGSFSIREDATARLTILAGGNVGIGKISPSTKLDVLGTISGSLITQNGAGNNYFMGNLGIGTASPANLFTVNQAGDVTVGTQATYGIALYNQGAVNLTLGSDASYAYLQSWGNKPLQINNQGNNTLINPISGNVGVGTTAPRAKLDVVGGMSGNTLYISRAMSGAGLVDCDIAGSSKLLWDATTGRFSCGTDQTAGSGLGLNDADLRYVNVAGDTMTGVLVIQNGNNATVTSTPLLNVRGTMSGRSLYISGTGSSPLLMTSVATGRVGIGTAAPQTALHIIGSIRSEGTTAGLFLKNTASTDGNAGVALVSFRNSTDGEYGWIGDGSAGTNNMQIYAGSGDILLTAGRSGRGVKIVDPTGTVLTATGGNIGIGTTAPKAKLDVVGAISGSRLIISNNASVSGSLVVLNNITSRGTISGSSLYIARNAAISGSLAIENNLSGATIGGFGLVDCSNSTTSKLLYNASTGKFVCSTDQTGGAGAPEIGTSSFSGATLRLADARYLRLSGGTLTGALNIRRTDPTLVGLNVAGTMSGRSLYISGTGSSPLLFTDVSRGTVSIGTTSPIVGTILEVYKSFNGNVDSTVLNDNAGTSAIARVLVHNGGSAMSMEKIGTGFSTSGAREAGYGVLFDSGTSGLNLVAGNTNAIMRFYTNGSASGNERMRIDAAGLVGIGTTTPGSKLSVSGAVVISNNGNLGSAAAKATLDVKGTISGALITQNGAGNNYFRGNVGIGTTTPSTQLHVYGSGSIDTGKIVVEDTSGTAYFLARNTVAPLGFRFGVQGNGQSQIGSLDNLALNFITNSSTKMFLQANGNVGIGSVSPNIHGYANNGGLLTIQNMTGTSLQGVLELANWTDADDQPIGDLSFTAASQRTAVSRRTALIRASLDGPTANNRGSSLQFFTRADGGTNDIVERMIITGTGYVGIGTSSPLAQLHVVRGDVSSLPTLDSGTVAVFERATSSATPAVLQMISGNASNTAINFGDTDDINVGQLYYSHAFNSMHFMTNNTQTMVLSGASVGIGTATPATKFEVVGSMSGNSLYISRSMSGAGLTDCDIAGSSKLLWDSTTGRFSCGTDQTAGSGLGINDADLRYVNVAGDTMTGVLVIQNGSTHTATTTPLLNVRGTLSGKNLYISATGSSVNPIFMTDSIRRVVAIGTAVPSANPSTLKKLLISDGSGNLIRLARTDGHGAREWDINIKGGNLVIGDNVTGVDRFTIDTTGNIAIGRGSGSGKALLDVVGTISGARLIITQNANVSGALLVIGGITSRGTISGSILHASTQLRSSGTLVVNGNGRFKSTLIILGSASGNIIHAEKSLTTSGSLVFEGTASGSSLYVATSINGAGLADCDTSGSSKLLWDASTGRFSCGTDNTGTLEVGTLSFSGAVLRLGDARYVRKAGDTMTGVLVIQNGSTHSATNTPLLNVRGTMSGRSIYLSGTGVALNPLIVTHLGTNVVLIGTGSVGTLPSKAKLVIDNRFEGENGSYVLMGIANRNQGAVIGLQNKNETGATLGAINFLNSAGIARAQISAWHLGNELTFRTNTLISMAISGSNVGIGAANPYARLSVSGAVIIGNNLDRVSADSNVLLEIIGTASGRVLRAQNTLASSGSLVWEGNATGSTLYVATSINGAGLADCDTGGTSKLLWDATTGRFSCGTDQTAGNAAFSGAVLRLGDARYVRKAGDTMSGALVIQNGNTPSALSTPLLNVRGLMSGSRLILTGNANITGTLLVVGATRLHNNLTVLGTTSGNVLHAEKTLSSSGILIVNQTRIVGSGAFVLRQRANSTGAIMTSTATGAPLLVLDARGTAQAPHILFGYRGTFDVAMYRSATGTLTLSGNLLPRVTNQSTLGSSLLRWKELYLSGSSLHVGTDGNEGTVGYNTGGSYFTIGTTSQANAFTILNSNGFVGIGTNAPKAKLDVVGAISGSRLIISNNATVSGSLVVLNGITSRGTISGSILHASTQLRSSGTLVVNGATRLKSTLTVLGTSSGKTFHAEKTLSSSGTLVFEGAASGSSLYVATSINGAGLADCDTGGSSKLLWDATTGRFSCGTDQTGGNAAFSGAVLRLGDARYVRKAGDTMTGTLVIQNGSTHTATSTPLLNVRGTLSGRGLLISGTGARPLISTSVATGRVGFGTGSPVMKFHFVGSGSDAVALFQRKNVNGAGAAGAIELLTDGQTAGDTVVLALRALDSAGTIISYGQIGAEIKSSTAGADTSKIHFITRSAGASNYRMTLDEDRLGIGTTSPKAKLDVVGAISGSRLIISNNATVSGALVVLNNITSRGTISGSILHASTQLRSSGTLVVNGATRLKSTLTVLGTSSGKTFHAEKTLSTSGTLVFEGNATGSTLYVATSINGAGLADCDTAATSKLMWDSTTGRFSCGLATNNNFGSGNVLTLGDARYVRKSGDTMSGALVIQNGNTPSALSTPLLNVRGLMSGSRLILTGNANITGTLLVVGATRLHNNLTVLGTTSGNVLHAEKTLSSSGILIVNQTRIVGSGAFVLRQRVNSTGAIMTSTATGSPLLVLDTRGTAQTPHILFGYRGTFDVAMYRSATGTLTLSGNLLPRVTNQSTLGTSALRWKDLYLSGSSLHIGTSGNEGTVGYNTGGSYFTIGTTSQSNAFTILNSNGNVGIGTNAAKTKLEVMGAISGQRLIISGNANISGSLVVLNNFTTRNALSGSIVHASSQLRSSGTLVVNGATRLKSTLTILGTSSGKTFHAEKTLSTSGTLVFEGNATGSTLYVATSINGAGLADCDTAGTSKLLWDSTTGRFSCGADQTGSPEVGTASFSGAVLRLSDARYVRKAGDTMTGTLVLQNGSTHTATSTPLLNVRGTMSGRQLVISGTGSAPLIITKDGKVGINIATPAYPLDIKSFANQGPAFRFQTNDGLAQASFYADSQNNIVSFGSITATDFGFFVGSHAAAIKVDYPSDNVGIGIPSHDAGSRLSISGAVVIGYGITTHVAKALLDTKGSMSGNSLYISRSMSGAGLTDCDIAASSKLLWDATTGRFSCGTEGAGGGVNTGSVLVLTDYRYVAIKGGSMTGSLQTPSINLSGTLLTSMNGHSQALNLNNAGLATQGISRLNANGNLINIGSIQSGEINSTMGGTFAARINKLSGGGPVDVAIGDFNGDGKADTAVANNTGNSVSVFLNTGTGGVSSKVDYAAGAAPYSVSVTDFNGDGKQDIAVANYDGNSVSIFLNTGTGGFAAKVDYTTDVDPISIAVGDLNGDGKPDIATANTNGSSSVSVLLNKGNGTFATKVDYVGGSFPYAIVIGDVNGDAKPDMAVANYGGTSVSIFMNKGNGTFAAKVDYSTTTALPVNLAIGDLNGDGKADLATVHNTNDFMSVLLNNGTGTFAAGVSYASDSGPYGIDIGDLNGDGKADVVTSNRSGESFSVFTNRGNGTFPAKVDYTMGNNPNAVAIADMNGDGKADIVTADAADDVLSISMNISKTVFYASAGTGGVVGIGTGTPGSKLSVSGSVIINPGGNLGNKKAKTALEVMGTMSGNALYVARSFSGAGLMDCDGTNDILQWDSTTGRFSCSSISTGDACPAGFTEVTASDNTLGCMETNEADVDGDTNRNEAGDETTWDAAVDYCFDTFGGRLPSTNEWYAAAANYSLTNETDDPEWNQDSVTGSNNHATSGNGSITDQDGSADGVSRALRCWIPKSAAGAGSSSFDMNDTDARYVRKAGGTMTGILKITKNGGYYTGALLNVLGTISGKVLHAETTLSSSGTLIFEGAASGSSLTLGTSLRGAGLSSCSSASSKLLWDSSTGRFSCGNDQGWTLIDTQTASNSATIDLETGINSTYDEYVIVVDGLVPATDATDLYMRISTNGGSTYEAGASDYGWTVHATDTGDATMSDASDNEITMNYSDANNRLSNVASEPYHGQVNLYSPASTAFKPTIAFKGVFTNNIGQIVSTSGNGTYLTAGSYDGVRFLMSSGNITSGTFRLYGIQKNSGADLAEQYYYSAGDITTTPAAGTVVRIDPLHPAHVKPTSKAYDSMVLGVVTTKPGIVLKNNADMQGGFPVDVALSGRVPVRVNAEGGAIAAGDYLTSSSVEGVAMKAVQGGQVIGKALEDLSSATGTILMFVAPGQNDPAAGSFTILASSGSHVDLLGLSASLAIQKADLSGGALLSLTTQETNGSKDVLRITTNAGSSGNTVFRINASGAVFTDATFNSAGADYAEWFKTPDIDLMPGDLVCVDVFQNNTVRKCARPADPNLMGIVSTNPAFIGNSIGGADGIIPPGYVLVGLIGQVPAKVMIESGAVINPGDSLTSASVAGFARRAKAGESTVGVALEGYDGTQEKNVINVLISRRNQSLTVETVEQHVLDSIASMNISDEVTRLVTSASASLDLDDVIAAHLSGSTLASGLGISSLTASNALLNARYSALVASGAALSARTASIESTIRGLSGSVSFIASHFSGANLHAAAGTFDSLETKTLKVEGTTVIAGPATIGSMTISGSIVQIGSITASGALKIMGNLTVTGFAEFLGDVRVSGELSVSAKQAGIAVVPKGGTGVTVAFSGAFAGTPIITATSDDFAPWRLRNRSQTGFTIELKDPAETDITFTWLALSSLNPKTTTGNGVAAPVLTPFPVNALGQPVSSDIFWNSCIQGHPLTLSGGEIVSCARYHAEYEWQHPDLGVSFTYRPNNDPPLLLLPKGYVATPITSPDPAPVPEPQPEPSSSSSSSSSAPAEEEPLPEPEPQPEPESSSSSSSSVPAEEPVTEPETEPEPEPEPQPETPAPPTSGE